MITPPSLPSGLSQAVRFGGRGSFQSLVIPVGAQPQKKDLFESTTIKRPPSRQLSLDDLQPGQQFQSRTTPEITAEEITDFARQYDPQPFHTDEEEAKNTFFGTLVASAAHTGAIATRLVVESVPLADGLVGTGMNRRFRLPVKPGDTLEVVTEVVSIDDLPSKPGMRKVHFHHSVHNQRGEPVEEIDTFVLGSQHSVQP